MCCRSRCVPAGALGIDFECDCGFNMSRPPLVRVGFVCCRTVTLWAFDGVTDAAAAVEAAAGLPTVVVLDADKVWQCSWGRC